MVNLDGQAVMDWRNEMMKIPGSQFISLMHLYLGEIKTPYRKETLLSAVSEFFKNQDVRNDLFARLDGTDSVIISAICLLKFATEKKLSVFLGRIIAPEFLLDRLNNLKARLLIYEKDFKGQRIYALNPIFPELEEFREDWKIFPSLSGGDNNVKDISYTSAFIPETLELFIGVFLFFTGNEGVLFKSNGEPKKKFLETAEGIFPGKNRLRLGADTLIFLPRGVGHQPDQAEQEQTVPPGGAVPDCDPGLLLPELFFSRHGTFQAAVLKILPQERKPKTQPPLHYQEGSVHGPAVTQTLSVPTGYRNTKYPFSRCGFYGTKHHGLQKEH